MTVIATLMQNLHSDIGMSIYMARFCLKENHAFFA